VIFDKKVSIDNFFHNKIEAKKYYYPLEYEKHQNSRKLFDNIICLPLNYDVNNDIIDKYISIISELNNY
jgi:dTDP-4-amino-4,6-dideoxygalactose transaminase